MRAPAVPVICIECQRKYDEIRGSDAEEAGLQEALGLCRDCRKHLSIELIPAPPRRAA